MRKLWLRFLNWILRRKPAPVPVNSTAPQRAPSIIPRTPLASPFAVTPRRLDPIIPARNYTSPQTAAQAYEEQRRQRRRDDDDHNGLALGLATGAVLGAGSGPLIGASLHHILHQSPSAPSPEPARWEAPASSYDSGSSWSGSSSSSSDSGSSSSYDSGSSCSGGGGE